MAGEFAILSPCSTCVNQRSVPDPNGGRQNICPRRGWQSSYSIMTSNVDADPDNSTSSVRHLALTGIDSQDEANNFSGGLVNPVYDDTGKSILVWIAMVSDNDAVTDPTTGAIVNPSILTGPTQFNTDYIQCKSYPYGPETNEASLFQSGGFREWETLSVTDNIEQPSLDGQSTESYGGTVKRAILLAQTPRKPTFDHECPEGI